MVSILFHIKIKDCILAWDFENAFISEEITKRWLEDINNTTSQVEIAEILKKLKSEFNDDDIKNAWVILKLEEEKYNNPSKIKEDEIEETNMKLEYAKYNQWKIDNGK